MAPLIPTIDISKFLEDPSSPEAAECVAEVQRACTTIGFLQIVGHGIPYDVQKEAFDGAKAFFELPLEEKRKVDRQTVPGANLRGYELLKSQVQSFFSSDVKSGDTKEGYYVGFDIPADDPVIKMHPRTQAANLWPPPSVLPYHIFKEPMERYHTVLVHLIRQMFSIVAAGLPEYEHVPAVFEEFTSNYPLALLSPKHYPPSDDVDAIGTAPHTDFGTLTLLLQDGTPGLEVRYEGKWIPVPPVKDAYVVNVGDMLQKWTRGRYKSTIHRVVAQRGTTHRYSMPFFFNGNPAVKLIPFDGAREGETIQTVEEHLAERLKKTNPGIK